MLSDEILDTAEETLDEIERAMQEITAQYENRWADTLDGMFADLYQTLDDLNEALSGPMALFLKSVICCSKPVIQKQKAQICWPS